MYWINRPMYDLWILFLCELNFQIKFDSRFNFHLNSALMKLKFHWSAHYTSKWLIRIKLEAKKKTNSSYISKLVIYQKLILENPTNLDSFPEKK